MLAITGGEKTKTKPFPPWPYYDHEEEEALREVLKSRQWWRTPGTKTLEFENAFAAYHRGKHGIAGTFSFQASKLMTAGEGGIILTNDDAFAQKARSVHDCGRMPGRWFYDHMIYGSNYRLSEWQGAVLGVQLKRLEAQGTKRFAHARLLDQLLGEIDGITPQALDERCTHNGHYAYIFHYDRGAFGGLPRERFIEALKAEGIPEQASYPPLHSLDLFTSGAYQQRLLPEDRWGEERMTEILKRAFPVTEKAAYETVWIPHFAFLGDERDIQEIAGAIGKIRRHASELWSS